MGGRGRGRARGAGIRGGGITGRERRITGGRRRWRRRRTLRAKWTRRTSGEVAIFRALKRILVKFNVLKVGKCEMVLENR